MEVGLPDMFDPVTTFPVSALRHLDVVKQRMNYFRFSLRNALSRLRSKYLRSGDAPQRRPGEPSRFGAGTQCFRIAERPYLSDDLNGKSASQRMNKGNFAGPRGLVETCARGKAIANNKAWRTGAMTRTNAHKTTARFNPLSLSRTS